MVAIFPLLPELGTVNARTLLHLSFFNKNPKLVIGCFGADVTMQIWHRAIRAKRSLAQFACELAITDVPGALAVRSLAFSNTSEVKPYLCSCGKQFFSQNSIYLSIF
jgi:hypothetical protein